MSGYEKRTQEKRKQVLETTFQLINSDLGVDSLTIDEIVRLSGVGKTSIFKYFGNKEKLIEEVYLHYMKEMMDSAKKIMYENRPFEETILTMTQNKINFQKKISKRFYMDLMSFVTKKEDKDFSSLLDQYTKESFDIMLDLFHRGRKEGKVDLKYSDEFLILYFQSLVEGISNPNIYERILPYTNEWTTVMIKGFAPSK